MELNKLANDIELNNEKNRNKEQINFLESTIGQIINTAVDFGISALFPDFIDEQVINIKDNMLNYGLKDGIKKTIEDAINMGKSAVGIFTGDFENISQMQSAIQTGGLIDGFSSLLDLVVDKINEKGIINYNMANTIKQGKDVILNSIENNIEKKFDEQKIEINNIEVYINNWKEDFNNKNFEGMDKEYNKIEKLLIKIAPLEEILKQAKIIGNLHNLIKNNGQDFNLNEEQLDLAEKLV